MRSILKILHHKLYNYVKQRHNNKKYLKEYEKAKPLTSQSTGIASINRYDDTLLKMPSN